MCVIGHDVTIGDYVQIAQLHVHRRACARSATMCRFTPTHASCPAYTIGDRAVVGAGSVVIHNVPARQHGFRQPRQGRLHALMRSLLGARHYTVAGRTRAQSRKHLSPAVDFRGFRDVAFERLTHFSRSASAATDRRAELPERPARIRQSVRASTGSGSDRRPGQRRLACPYHGWVYDDDGTVKSIPGCDSQLRLTPESVADVGCSPSRFEASAISYSSILMRSDADRGAIPSEAFLRRLEEVSGYLDDEALFAQFGSATTGSSISRMSSTGTMCRTFIAASFAPLMPACARAAAEPGNGGLPVPDSEIGDELRELSATKCTAPLRIRRWPWHDWVDRFCAG